MRDSYHFKLKMKLFMFLKQNAKEMKIFKIVSAKEKECNDGIYEKTPSAFVCWRC